MAILFNKFRHTHETPWTQSTWRLNDRGNLRQAQPGRRGERGPGEDDRTRGLGRERGEKMGSERGGILAGREERVGKGGLQRGGTWAGCEKGNSRGEKKRTHGKVGGK